MLHRFAVMAGERLKIGLVAFIVLVPIGLGALLLEVEALKDKLRADAQSIASQVSQMLAEGTTLLSALHGYYQNSGEMPAERFPLLADRFLDSHSHVAWVGYATRVNHDQVDDFRRNMVLEGFLEYRITSFPEGVTIMGQPYHLPFSLLEPLEPKVARVLGHDLLTHPRWHQALYEAIRSGQTTAVETDGLFGNLEGILLLRATYRGVVEPYEPQARQQQLAGMLMIFLDTAKLTAARAGMAPSLRAQLIAPQQGSFGEVPVEIFSSGSKRTVSPTVWTTLPIEVANLQRSLKVQMDLKPSLAAVFASMAIALVPVITIVLAIRSRRAALQTERNAFAQARLAEATLGSIDDAVIRVDEGGRVRYLNPKARAITGRTDQLHRTRCITEVMPLSSAEGSIRDWPRLHAMLTSATPLSFVGEDGVALMLSGTLAPVVGEHRDADGYVLAFRDVTREHQLASELKHQASHDPLTELPNRRAFEAHLQCAVDDARDNGSHYTLLYLDLDQFKLVNDTSGHAAGDQMLRQLSGLLAAECRTRDVLARLGGDEFGVLLHHCEVAQATPIAQRICDTVTGFRFTWDGRAFELGASIGVVAISSTSGTADDVQRAADLACYAAKDMGRNRYHVYRQEDRIIARNESDMKWQSEIKTAIEDRRLVLHGQPIVALTSNANPKGLNELLLRMRANDGELIPPRAFIPSAERYGLMKLLDRQVVRLAFDHLSTIADDGIVRAINLSGQTITDPEFEAFVMGAVTDFELDPSRVCFEITETSAISNMNVAIKLMNRMRARGFSFALDDFGAGLSSLSYLKQLPVNFLKIDGQFVRDLDHDAVARSMVSSIVSVASVLGIQCIAEMVEDGRTQTRLIELGVDYAQGYFLGRPKPLVSVVSSALIA